MAASVASSVSHFRPSTVYHLASGGGAREAPRRLFFYLGASFLDHLHRMTSSSGSRSLTASARPQHRISPVEQILKDVKWPDKFPFRDEDFSRFDESLDSLFYSEPRFVTHIDDLAISALTKYYSVSFPPSNTPGCAYSIFVAAGSAIIHRVTGKIELWEWE
ncbi:hypothetical protein KSP39_PZI019904 [Platanthera zijinensis]|uniref:Uncharacterized protein n=1 Tax=Platanthera zijinensis TaxID=2320716 RepID=A0AAP0FWJ8_9ASPA